MTDQSLYDRLVGVYAIAAVIDRFSHSHGPIVTQRDGEPI